MFEDLTRKLELVFKNLRGQGKISEENVAGSLREVRRVLLDADVNYKVVKDFIAEVQRRALGQEVLRSLTPGQLIIKIIHDELVKLLGTAAVPMRYAAMPPTIILIAGLQGSGKTTFSGKLAVHLHSKGRHPLLVAADVHRPAAIDQLEMLGKQAGIPVHSERGKGAVEIAVNSIDRARKGARDVVIIDTAGRLHVDEEMMREVETVKSKVSPHEILFVVDAMTGQDAVTSAKAFHDRLDFDGIVLTKLDGDARGGAALSIRSVVNKPVRFVGTGEKLDALEVFHPDRMASRILGMGDVVTLVEKAQERFDTEKAVTLEAKLRKSQFTLEDFAEQLREVKKMGSVQEILGMIPGMSRVKAGDIDEKGLVRVEAIIQSMTPVERRKPDIINGQRRKRIAAGSGTSVQEVNRVLKQFYEMQKMMKALARGKKPPLPKQFRGMRLPA